MANPRVTPPPLSLPGRPQQLQTRVGLALGALIIAASVILAVVLGKTAEQRVIQVSGTNLSMLSEQMARELSEGMDQFGKEVRSQTHRRQFQDPSASLQEMRGALDQFKADNPEFAYVSIVEVASAKVIAANGGIFEGGDATGRPTFVEGTKGLYLGDVHDAVRLAELLPKAENGETRRFLDVAAPIADASGKVFRVFAAHVASEWIAQVRAHVIEPVKEQRGIDVFLIDTRGKVVLSGAPSIVTGTDLSTLNVAQSGSATKVSWADQQDYLTAVAATRPRGRFSGFGWQVVTRQPYTNVLAPVRSLYYAFLLSGLALGVAAAALAWFVTARLLRPVRLLAQAAVDMGNSQPSSELMPDTAAGEISTVHQALTRLADSAKASVQASSMSARQFAVLAESLPQVVWQSDSSGLLEYINRDWVRSHQPTGPFRVDDFAGRIHDEDRPMFASAWQQSRAALTPMHVRVRVQTDGDPAYRWFDLHANSLLDDDGNIQCWVGTLFDVHEMVMLSQAMDRALGEERSARADAERLARLRDEFLASVSHELRSPLSAITGWSEILLRKKGADAMVNQAGTVIRRNADIQVALINDLLDMTAVISGRLVLDRGPVDVSKIARDVVLSHLHAAQQKGVELAAADIPPILVEGDSRRLLQVLSNVVGNAIKFTPAGGRIEVRRWADAGRAILQVTDNGCGISQAFLPHVFDRMRQEDASVTRRAGGLGLGLAIARGIVDLHQGTITVSSPGTGNGTTVTLSLPLSVANDASFDEGSGPYQEVADAAPELAGARILLVDDEQDAREVAQVALASLGAEVRAVASAAEALKLLEGEEFDVLVSDIGMPEMDGLALIRLIRGVANKGNRSLPAVALTAFAMETDVRAGKEAGFHAHVAKPISLVRLSKAILAAREHA